MPVFVRVAAPVARWRSLKGWELGPAPGAFSLMQLWAAPSTPLPWVERGASEWKVGILSAALAPTGSRDQDLMDSTGASPSYDLCHRLVYCHLPRDCAYRNYFFVKTHNSESALAPGFCFITFYWSRKKEHIIILLLHVFSWLKRATSTLCKQKSQLCCLRTGRWERQDEGLSQTVKETPHRAGLGRMGGRPWEWRKEIICTHPLARPSFIGFSRKSDLGGYVSSLSGRTLSTKRTVLGWFYAMMVSL